MSSLIRHIHYKAKIEELSIWFAPHGRRYIYSSVPEPVYRALLDAPSRGAFFNRHIRGRYACRLADVPEKLIRRWQAIHSAS